VTQGASYQPQVPPGGPVVTGVSPVSGSVAGGDTVIITGAGFTGVTGVSFGAAPAAITPGGTDTQLTVTSPPGAVAVGATSPPPAAVTVGVIVTTPAGTYAATPADEFTYVPPAGPVVTGVSPASGSVAGGDTVIITGTGFTGATGASFGPDVTVSVTVDSDTQITATSPLGAGTVDVIVTTPAGTSAATPADEFTYL
jgi:hypothetical protein